jgi:hypothetical protein
MMEELGPNILNVREIGQDLLFRLVSVMCKLDMPISADSRRHISC